MPIEKVSSELERIVSLDQEIEELGRGFLTAEGPVWYREGGYLLFSDIRNSRRMKWSLQEGVSLFQEPTNEANGLTRDLQGRVIACERSTRRVSRLDDEGSITVVADHYGGKRLNRPNDVVVKSDGSIYFTDPGAPDPELDLDFSGAYKVSSDLSGITLVARDIAWPNGLAFSPDERVFYVSNSRTDKYIGAFDVQADGMLTNSRVFFNFKSDLPGNPDGMKVDVEGNVYCTGPGGVWIIDVSGQHLGTILTGSDQTTNCAWGGEDWKTLFITTREIMGRIQLKIAGIPVPR